MKTPNTAVRRVPQPRDDDPISTIEVGGLTISIDYEDGSMSVSADEDWFWLEGNEDGGAISINELIEALKLAKKELSR